MFRASQTRKKLLSFFSSAVWKLRKDFLLPQKFRKINLYTIPSFVRDTDTFLEIKMELMKL